MTSTAFASPIKVLSIEGLKPETRNFIETYWDNIADEVEARHIANENRIRNTVDDMENDKFFEGSL